MEIWTDAYSGRLIDRSKVAMICCISDVVRIPASIQLRQICHIKLRQKEGWEIK